MVLGLVNYSGLRDQPPGSLGPLYSVYYETMEPLFLYHPIHDFARRIQTALLYPVNYLSHALHALNKPKLSDERTVARCKLALPHVRMMAEHSTAMLAEVTYELSAMGNDKASFDLRVAIRTQLAELANKAEMGIFFLDGPHDASTPITILEELQTLARSISEKSLPLAMSWAEVRQAHEATAMYAEYSNVKVEQAEGTDVQAETSPKPAIEKQGPATSDDRVPNTWNGAAHWLVTFDGFLGAIDRRGKPWVRQAKQKARPVWSAENVSLYRVADLVEAVKQASGSDLLSGIFPRDLEKKIRSPDFVPPWASRATVHPPGYKRPGTQETASEVPPN